MIHDPDYDKPAHPIVTTFTVVVTAFVLVSMFLWVGIPRHIEAQENAAIERAQEKM